MKHVTIAGLTELDPLLGELRDVDGLEEKKRGVFYRGSRAFLHFHEDPTGFYADVRLDGTEFERMRVSTKAERKRLLSRVRAAMRR
ncbi:MAG TPA: hypothetical protein VKI01_10670 [Acidimicrobiia bacterium]|nr:hypothetical protein [Acidimicrobiia bacterium]